MTAGGSDQVFQGETQLEVLGAGGDSDPAVNFTAGQDLEEGNNLVYQEVLNLVDGVWEKFF